MFFRISVMKYYCRDDRGSPAVKPALKGFGSCERADHKLVYYKIQKNRKDCTHELKHKTSRFHSFYIQFVGIMFIIESSYKNIIILHCLQVSPDCRNMLLLVGIDLG